MMYVLNDERQIQDVVEMILTTFGIKLPETHYRDVTKFIENRLSARGQTLSDYISSLSHDREEYSKFVDTVTINESYFFRDQRHFSLLYHNILPELLQRNDHLKIWSAATACGEEAMSIAVMCETLLKNFPGKEYTIYASDINISSLQNVATGRYRKSVLRTDGSAFHHLLSPYITEYDDGFLVHEDIRRRIIESEHNLYTEDYSGFPNDFDLVMLRNVFIYMPIENRNKVVQKISEKIAGNGILFLSAGEIPLIWHPCLQVEERESIYFLRKRPLGECASGGEPRFCEVSKEEPVAVKDSEAAEQLSSSPFVEKKKNPRGKQHKNINNDELYNRINYHLSAPHGSKNDTPENKLAETFIHLIDLINVGSIQDAERVLAELESELPNNEVVLYYYGIIEKMKGCPEKSARYFRKALDCFQRFWPARYELAMRMKEKSPLKATKQFGLCKKHIRLYFDKGDYSYHFLLDGFNALYFLQICEFWEKRLTSGTE